MHRKVDPVDGREAANRFSPADVQANEREEFPEPPQVWTQDLHGFMQCNGINTQGPDRAKGMTAYVKHYFFVSVSKWQIRSTCWQMALAAPLYR